MAIAGTETASVTGGSVYEELLRVLARQGRRMPLPIFLVAAVIASMAAEHISPRLPLAWLSLVVAVLALRWFVLSRLPTLVSIGLSHRVRLAIALAGVSGVTHGLSLGFFWSLPEFERAIQSMLLVSLCAGSVGTTVGYMPVFLAYMLPILAPLSILWAMSSRVGGPWWIETMTAVLVIFLALILVALARDAFRLFKESFEIRLQQIETNAKLVAALNRAEAANRAKTRFLASASHDLRQPMHTLSVFAAALGLRPLDERSRTITQHMNDALQDLSSELDSLLDVSKLDAGLVTVNRKPLSLKSFVDRLHETYSADAQTKNLNLDVHCPNNAFTYTDKSLLERVVRNLVENAIKYTDSGTVSILVQAEPEVFKLSVADTGPGIPENEHQRVFEEFYQLNNPERDRARGLGLGLAIVKRLLELLEIDLEFISSPGMGSQFILSLPASNAGDHPSAEIGNHSYCLKGLHVLIVDDEAKVRLGMRELLENLGCQVTEVDCTEEAIISARNDPPDIVLADLRLRGADHGIATVRAIRETYPEMPALLVSGDTAPQRLIEADSAGIPLLHKPVNLDVLTRAVAKATKRGAVNAK